MIWLLSIFFIQSTATPEGGAKTPSYALEGGKTVTISSIQFVGNKEIPSQQLQRLLAPYLNRSLSESDINEMKQRIELLYRSKGYDQVVVSIPEKQKSQSLVIQIEEGKKSK